MDKDSGDPPVGRRRASLTHTNRGPSPLPVWIEPWCDECLVQPGSTIRFESEADEGVGLDAELEIEPDRLVFWGCGGSIMRVYVDNVPLPTASAAIEVPLAIGSSAKSLIKLLFGSSDGQTS